MKSITTEEEVAMNHTLNDDVNVELEYELIKMERKRNKLIFAAMIIGMAIRLPMPSGFIGPGLMCSIMKA